MDDEDKKEGQGFLQKGKEKAKDAKDKFQKAKKAFKLFMKLPTPVKIAIIVLILAIILIIIFAAFLYEHRLGTYDSAIDSVNGLELLEAELSASEGGSPGSVTGISNLVKMDGNEWVLSIPDSLKKKLEDEGIDISGMTEEQILVELLKLNGLKDKNFTDDELNLLPYLFKAEIATQYMDLRPESEMYKNGSYNVPKIDLDDKKIPGTIHLKRISSMDKSSINLSYVDYETFKSYENNIDEAKKYFSFNDDGNVVVYTWNHTKITYQYDKTPDAYKKQESDNYFISETVIDYKNLVNSYTLPYEVLVALLVTTRDVDFTKDVADLAYNSNIEIGLMEEYQRDQTVNTTDYYQTIRGYQFQEGRITVNGLEAYKTDKSLIHLLSSSKETVECSHGGIHGNKFTYSKSKPESGGVAFTTIETVLTETNSYKYGVLYADTWFVKTEKDFSVQPDKSVSNSTGELVEGSYIYDNENVVTGNSAFNNIKDANLKNNINTKISEAKTKVIPSVSVNSDTATIRTNLPMTNFYYTKKVVNDETSETTYQYSGVSCNNHTTLTVSNFAAGKPYSVSYKNGVWYKSGETPTADYSNFKLTTTEYLKTDYITKTKSATHRYNFVEGTTKNEIYDKKDQKLLKAIDSNKKARASLENIPSWFYEMIEKYDTNYKAVLEYLIDRYFGRAVKNDFNVDDFLSQGIGQFNSLYFGNGTGWWWPIGSNETETINGKLFAGGTPALGKSNVSRAGKKQGTYPGTSVAAHPSAAGGWAVDIRSRRSSR